MGGLSEVTSEATNFSGFIYTDSSPSLGPSWVDITINSNTGSFEYAYRGTIENGFTITGYGIEGPDDHVRSGLLLTGQSDAFRFLDSSEFGPFYYEQQVVNSGTIHGLDYSILGTGNLTTLIINTGKLEGDVALGDGEDQLINRGKIIGAVDTGDVTGWFDQRDYIENHGIIRSGVTLGNGNDIFTSFSDARVGSKNKPAPVMGMDGDDILTGAARADKFLGGKGSDTLVGGKGSDRLFGNHDDDLLRGGAGDDLLAGGLGKDWMIGGDGADIFRFHSVLTSERGGKADRIADFEIGVDRIDLSRIGDDIDFVGTADFAGSGQAELRYYVSDQGTARVLLDLDGDGKSDMRINLLDTPSVSDTDFIL